MKKKAKKRAEKESYATNYKRTLIVRLIRLGKTTPQIVAYCKVPRQSVAAYRAHLTLGHIS